MFAGMRTRLPAAPAFLFLAAFLAGQTGTRLHYGDCTMARSGETGAEAPGSHDHGQHSGDSSQSDQAGCDCKGPQCCPPAVFPHPVETGRALVAAVVEPTPTPYLSHERLPSPVTSGPVAARAPPSLL